MASKLDSLRADHELILELERLSEGGKLIRSSNYSIQLDEPITLRSWKMQEHKYYSVPSPFPTLARGLFTTTNEKAIKDDASEQKHEKEQPRIVARGYDKFFNIGEVPWCAWHALEKHSVGPYEMTLKTNGCIIFIAALTPTRILVTSKHSTGHIESQEVSHAEMGEKWLDKHLEAVGKSKEQLAHTLWENRWTAVAELCDDDFEEHVLPYSKEQTGLHLHGINHSSGVFKTLPSEKVTEFAEEWGFLKTPYLVVNSLQEVRALSDNVAKTGKWNGEAIEGFVVRCHVSNTSKPDPDSPPYQCGSSFFFKVKFDEPYLMYRDWREVTKILLIANSKGELDSISLPKSKLRRPETILYIAWARREIATNPERYEMFAHGKGIIATRERFLKHLEQEGSSELEQITASLDAIKLEKEVPKKVIIAPISVQGCGKTTISVALCHLFNFGHVQSDNFKKKGGFLKEVQKHLSKYDVVIADKNNHCEEHRQDLKELGIPVRVIALNWVLDAPPAMVHRICSQRIMLRGNNHQKLVADPENKSHEQAIWMLLNQREELKEGEVDEIIDMELEDSLENNLARAVNACVDFIGLKKPSAEEIGRALAEARSYKAPRQGKIKEEKKEKKIRYYALLPEIKLAERIGKQLEGKDVPGEIRVFWKELKDGSRIEKSPHITIVHMNEADEKTKKKLWDKCEHLCTDLTPLFDFELGHIVTDGRVLVLTVDNLRPRSTPDDDATAEMFNFVKVINTELANKLHVTVGTRRDDIRPFESRSVVEKWRRKGDQEGVWSYPLKNISVSGILGGGR